MKREEMIAIIKDNMKSLCLSKGVPYNDKIISSILEDYKDVDLKRICGQIDLKGWQVLERI